MIFVEIIKVIQSISSTHFKVEIQHRIVDL